MSTVVAARLSDDTVLRLARTLHRVYTRRFATASGKTRVAGLSDNFKIDKHLRIFVPHASRLTRLPQYRSILLAGIAHEDAHEALTPGMSRLSVFNAAGYLYAKRAGVPWNPQLLHMVGNAVSDVVNEAILAKKAGLRDEILLLHKEYAGFDPGRMPGWEHVAERDPAWGLLMAHTVVLEGGSCRAPVCRLAVELHRLKAARRFMIVNVMDAFGDLRSVFNQADNIYEELKRGWCCPPLPRNPYAAFMAVAFALYRLYAEGTTEAVELRNVEMDAFTGIPDEGWGTGGIDIVTDYFGGLGPRAAEAAARRILPPSILLARGRVQTETGGSERVSWLRRPLRPVPASMQRPWWEWVARRPGPGVERGRGRAPGAITFIIDESGSVMTPTDILEPIVGLPVRVYDVERVTGMALLLPLLERGVETRVNIVTFTTMARVHEFGVKTGYGFLRDRVEPESGGTDLAAALDELPSVHRDSNDSLIVLFTDFEVGPRDLQRLDEVVREFSRSTWLIVSYGEWPDTVQRLALLRGVEAVHLPRDGFRGLAAAVARLARRLAK